MLYGTYFLRLQSYVVRSINTVSGPIPVVAGNIGHRPWKSVGPIPVITGDIGHRPWKSVCLKCVAAS